MKKLIALMLEALLLLSGCGQAAPAAAETGSTAAATTASQPAQTAAAPAETTPQAPDADQYINYALYSDPKLIDTTQTNVMTDLTIASNIGISLTRLQMANGQLTVMPYGAASWSKSDDGMVYTFKLADAKWEDGVKVTAQQYVDALRRILDPNLASVCSESLIVLKNAAKIRTGDAQADTLGARAVDDSTLELTLEYYIPYFMDLTYSPVFSPVRLDVIEKSGSKYGTDADTLISCGAFKVKDWTHDASLTLVKNDAYFEADKVKLSQINFKVIKDPNAIMSELFSGGIDRSSVSNTEWRQKLIASGNYNYGDFVIAGTYMLAVNTNYTVNGVKLLSNAKIRQALSAAIDREEACEVAAGGLGVPATGFIPSAMSIDGKNFREEAGYSPVAEIEKISDPRALFLEGLKELGADPDPAKYPIKFLVRDTTPAQKDVAEYYYALLQEKIGCTLDITQVESAVGRDMTRSGDFGLTPVTFYADYNDPNSMMSTWLSTSTSNYNTGFSSSTYDSAVAAANKALDHAERVRQFTAAEKEIVADQAVLIPVFHPVSSMMTAKYVCGFQNEASTFGPTLFATVYTSGRK